MPTITEVGNPSNSLTTPPLELDEFLPVIKTMFKQDSQ